MVSQNPGFRDYLKEANLPETGKTILYDGCSGEPFYQKIVVGYMYMLKAEPLGFK
jgi:DNA-directed RNA polymerase subunit beta